MNQICRLLSGAGLAQRLVYALGSAIAFSRDVKVISFQAFLVAESCFAACVISDSGEEGPAVNLES